MQNLKECGHERRGVMTEQNRSSFTVVTFYTTSALVTANPSPLGHPISPALDRIVRRCLEKDPEQRFQSAKDLSFALGALSGTDSSGAAQIGETHRKVP